MIVAKSPTGVGERGLPFFFFFLVRVCIKFVSILRWQKRFEIECLFWGVYLENGG